MTDTQAGQEEQQWRPQEGLGGPLGGMVGVMRGTELRWSAASYGSARAACADLNALESRATQAEEALGKAKRLNEALVNAGVILEECLRMGLNPAHEERIAKRSKFEQMEFNAEVQRADQAEEERDDYRARLTAALTQHRRIVRGYSQWIRTLEEGLVTAQEERDDLQEMMSGWEGLDLGKWLKGAPFIVRKHKGTLPGWQVMPNYQEAQVVAYFDQESDAKETAAYLNGLWQDAESALATAQEENERLRAALERIIKDAEMPIEHMPLRGPRKHLAEIAAAALTHTEEQGTS